MRTPLEVAYQGYGIFRGEYSAAATVTQAESGTLSRCVLVDGWNAWLCSADVIEPARLIIEDEDDTNFERQLVPVALASGGYVNLMNGGKSWKWDGALRRRNTFITTVALGRDYDLSFFSTNPESLHYQLPNQDDSKRVRIGCFYSNPQRLVVSWMGKYQRDLNPSGYDFTNVVRPTTSHPCGSNTYVGWENKLYFTLCGTPAGEKGIQIRTLPVVRLAITSTQLVDVGLDEFYDAPGQMMTNIVALFGIPRFRVRTVSVVPDSAETGYGELGRRLSAGHALDGNGAAGNGSIPADVRSEVCKMLASAQDASENAGKMSKLAATVSEHTSTLAENSIAAGKESQEVLQSVAAEAVQRLENAEKKLNDAVAAITNAAGRAAAAGELMRGVPTSTAAGSSNAASPPASAPAVAAPSPRPRPLPSGIAALGSSLVTMRETDKRLKRRMHALLTV